MTVLCIRILRTGVLFSLDCIFFITFSVLVGTNGFGMVIMSIGVSSIRMGGLSGGSVTCRLPAIAGSGLARFSLMTPVIGSNDTRFLGGNGACCPRLGDSGLV